ERLLLVIESAHVRRWLSLPLRAQRGDHQLHAADVGDVLAQGQVPVQVHVVDRDVPVVLLRHARGTMLVRLGDARRPPLPEVSVAVELAALIVEAVRPLVTHPHAETYAIGGLRRLRYND